MTYALLWLLCGLHCVVWHRLWEGKQLLRYWVGGIIFGPFTWAVTWINILMSAWAKIPWDKEF